MAEFIVGGTKYQSKKLDVFVQINIARRLVAIVPALGPLGPLLQNLSVAAARMGGTEGADSEAAFDLSPVNPLFKAFGELSDDDTQYIVKMCLSATSKAEGAGFVPLWNLQANRPQYNDLTFSETLQIVWYVLADNLGSFTNAPA